MFNLLDEWNDGTADRNLQREAKKHTPHARTLLHIHTHERYSTHPRTLQYTHKVTVYLFSSNKPLNQFQFEIQDFTDSVYYLRTGGLAIIGWKPVGLIPARNGGDEPGKKLLLAGEAW